jgi:hypothetical protein
MSPISKNHPTIIFIFSEIFSGMNQRFLISQNLGSGYAAREIYAATESP